MGLRFSTITLLTLAAAVMVGCATSSERYVTPPPTAGYKQAMRDFVQGISSYARSVDPNFIVIPQNGDQLLTSDGTASGTPDGTYLDAISGVGREDLFYGYTGDNIATPQSARDGMLPLMKIAQKAGKAVLAIDYCSTHSKMDDSYSLNEQDGFVSFAADHRELDDIPGYPSEPHNINSSDVTTLAGAKNFLYLINPQNYQTKADFLAAIQKTNYDLMFVDLFFNGVALAKADVDSLETKANGGKRLVVAYMSIGEAETYRYYWKSSWNSSPPAWLADENPNWPGNYKVRYWDPDWQAIIYGNDSSYLKRIMDAGFNGVYLDIVDAYEYFERS